MSVLADGTNVGPYSGQPRIRALVPLTPYTTVFTKWPLKTATSLHVLVSTTTDESSHKEVIMNASLRLSAFAVVSLAILIVPVRAGEEHGHCSGPNVCKGDAECEKKGFKELTREQCAKVDGARFEASSHAGDGHKDEKHDHGKK